MSLSKVSAIIIQSFKRKQRKNRDYSHAVLAREMKVSRVFISGLLSGQKKIPIKRLDHLAEVLDMDAIAREALASAMLEEQISQMAKESLILKHRLLGEKKSRSTRVYEKFEEIALKSFTQLLPWYNVTILDLISTHDFRLDFEWMSNRLGLPLSAVKVSWHYLVEQKFIENIDGKWRKTTSQIRVPTRTSQQEIRQYHEKLILKGLSVMNSKTSKSDFEKRLITGITLSANSEKIEEVKSLLNQMQFEAAEAFQQDRCDEVYHIAVMLYPLSSR